MSLSLRNPHSVLAALKHRPQDVLEVKLFTTRPAGAWEEVADLAASQRIPVQRNAVRVEAGRRTRKTPGAAPGRTGAAEATVREKQPQTIEQVFAAAEPPGNAFAAGGIPDGSPERYGLWLALDQLQDPQNVGAIFRAASFFGVRGILLTRDRSAPLNGAVYDVSSGGLEAVPFASIPNLSRALDLARKSGLWVLGTSEHAETDLSAVARDRPWLLVVGNEEKGLRRLTSEKCDVVCRISGRGEVGSLNVSVAAGVMMATLSGAVGNR